MFEMKIKILIFSFLLGFTTIFAEMSHSQSDTVAIIGKKIITLEEFQKYYKEKIRKVGLTDNGEIRIKYLQNLVDDEVLLLDAKKKGIDKTKSALTEFERIKTQELLNAYSKKIIEPAISINEQDIKSMYIKMNTKIKVKHLYALNLQDAEKLYDEIKNGKSFEELARVVFHDEQLKEYGGDLGYISVDEMDPNFEAAAYSMKIGETSQPIKTVTGYSIIKVEDIKQNPFVIESEYLKAHDRIKAFVAKRAYENAAKQYTANQKKELEIKFDKSLIEQLYQSLESFSGKNHLEKSSSFYLENKNRIVVRTKNGNWNMSHLISELQLTSEDQRKWIHNATDLEDFISGLIIRKNTLQKAEAAQLDKSPEFKQNVDYNFNTYLIQQVEKQLRDKIYIPDESIKAYYNENCDRFRKESEMRLSSILVYKQSVADSIEKLLIDGISFEKLAQEFSIQMNTAKNKGDMGFFRKSDLGNLGDKVFGMNPGQWMGPISDDGKYLFLKCTSIKPPVWRNLSEVSEEIKETLKALSWYKSRTDYTSSLKKEFQVQLFPEKITNLNLLTNAYER